MTVLGQDHVKGWADTQVTLGVPFIKAQGTLGCSGGRYKARITFERTCLGCLVGGYNSRVDRVEMGIRLK
jgi:hypothetical protein